MGDLQLRQDVIDELEYEPSLDAAHIGVAADKGVVILTGHVASYAEKQIAITAVRQVKGVRAIAEEIEVRYPSDKKTSDDQIAKRAIDILGWDTMVPSGSIQVMVRDGCVTLTGSVDWHYQKKQAEEDIRKLSGVRGVINNVEIEPSGASRTAHSIPLTNRRPPRPALLRYLRLRAAGLGSVRGVVLGRETGGRVRCDLTNGRPCRGCWPMFGPAGSIGTPHSFRR